MHSHSVTVETHPDMPTEYYGACSCGSWSLVVGPKRIAEQWTRMHTAEVN